MRDITKFESWSNLFVYSLVFPHPKVGTFTQILFIQPNVFSEGGLFYGYALLCDIFCLSRSKMAIFMLLCTLLRHFSPSEERRSSTFT